MVRARVVGGQTGGQDPVTHHRRPRPAPCTLLEKVLFAPALSWSGNSLEMKRKVNVANVGNH